MGVPEGRVRPPAPVPLRNGVPEGRVRPPAPVPLRNPDSGGLEGVEVPLSRWVHEGGSGQRLYRLLSTDSIPLRSWRQNSLRGRREWPLPMAITAQNTSQTAWKPSHKTAYSCRFITSAFPHKAVPRFPAPAMVFHVCKGRFPQGNA